MNNDFIIALIIVALLPVFGWYGIPLLIKVLIKLKIFSSGDRK